MAELKHLGQSTARGYEAAVYEDEDYTMHFFPLDDLEDEFGASPDFESGEVIGFVKAGLGLA